MTSPDTSAAEVVAWRVRQQMYPETRWGRWTVYDYRPNWSNDPSVEYDALVPKSLLDASRAETAAANARADALERELGAMHQMRIKIPLDTIEKAKRVEPLEAKLAKAVEVLTFIASSSMSTAHDCKQAARAGLTEIEGKSK